MLERLLLPEGHAIAVLLKDHDRVKGLFDRFEAATTTAEKERIIKDVVNELKLHAAIEEEIFYPTVRKHVGTDLMNEADEEHHVARILIAELDDRRRNDHRHAKFTVLAENVRHHIKEEESDVLPKAKDMKVDFEALGAQMLARKQVLQAEGVPPDSEHAMVRSARGQVDTPAATAHRGQPRRKARRVRPSKPRPRASKRSSHR